MTRRERKRGRKEENREEEEKGRGKAAGRYEGEEAIFSKRANQTKYGKKQTICAFLSSQLSLQTAIS